MAGRDERDARRRITDADVATSFHDEADASGSLFDIRYLIGGLFTVYGIVLIVAGFFVSNAKSGGMNINLYLGIAMLILGMMGLTLYASFFLGFQVIGSSRDDLRATQILTQKTEAVRLCTWSQLTNFTFREYYDPAGATNGQPGTLYTGTVTTNAANNISDSNAYKANMRLITDCT